MGFAENKVLRPHVGRFQRDIRICLRQDEKTQKHAYFPALMTCISFLDLMSGLYCGDVEYHSYEELRDYVDKFMDRAVYTDLNLAILYEGLRHKIAHLAHPYFVFDTATKKNPALAQRKRIVWSVHESDERPPIRLVGEISKIQSYKLPWPVPFDHRIHIHLASFSVDIADSVLGSDGYLAAVKKDKRLQDNIAKCMKRFFPE